MVVSPNYSVLSSYRFDNATLPRLLFLCICIMLLPLVISSTRSHDDIRVSIEMIAIPYVLQVVALSVALLSRPLRFSRGAISTLLAFIVIELTSQLLMAAGGRP